MATAKKVRTGEEFVFCSGAGAATVAQCRAELAKLTPDQFAYHVNVQKNDIFNWLRDCLDPKLAKKIQLLTDRDKMIRALAPAPDARRKA